MLRRTLVLAVCLAFGDLLTSGGEPVGSIDCANDRGCRYGRLRSAADVQGHAEVVGLAASEGSRMNSPMGTVREVDASEARPVTVQGHGVSEPDERKDAGKSAVRIKVDDTPDATDFRGVLINRMRDDQLRAAREVGRSPDKKLERRYYESYQTATENSMELIRNVEGYVNTDQRKMKQSSQLDGARMSRNIGEWFRTLNKGPRNRGDQGDLVESSHVSFNLGRIVRGVQRYFNETDFGKGSGANGTWTSRMLGGFFDGLESNSTEVTGRKKYKEKGYGRILLYMAGAMKAWMLYMMIHAVGAIAGKALVVAKIALAIAIAVALKKSGEHHDKTSYEIVKHPHHSYVQTHSSSVDYDHHGYGESGYGSHRRHRRRTYR